MEAQIVLARVPERIFANGVWVRQPPVGYVRVSRPIAAQDDAGQPRAAAKEVSSASFPVEAPLLPVKPAAAPAQVVVSAPEPQATAASSKPIAPLASPLASDIKPVEPPAPAAAPVPQTEMVAAPVSGKTSPASPPAPTPAAAPSDPIVIAPRPADLSAVGSQVAGPAAAAPVSMWSSRSVEDVAAAFARSTRDQAWPAQAQQRLGHVPRVSVGTIEDKSGGKLGVERLVQALPAGLRTLPSLTFSSGSPPEFEIVGRVALAGGQFVQVDLRVLEISSKQSVMAFSIEVPTAGSEKPAGTGKGGYVP